VVIVAGRLRRHWTTRGSLARDHRGNVLGIACPTVKGAGSDEQYRHAAGAQHAFRDGAAQQEGKRRPGMRRHHQGVRLVMARLGENRLGSRFVIHGSLDAEPRAEVAEQRAVLAQALAGPSERERTVLRLRYVLDNVGREYNLEEVARALAVSRERIRQLEVRALSRLRRGASGTLLRRYVAS
jgi:RNA polymerase sigma factor (sigma-70 family)